LITEQDIWEWWQVMLPEGAIILYGEQYSDWSWGELLLVFQVGNRFYTQDDSDAWKPTEVPQEEALAMMLDFEEIVR